MEAPGKFLEAERLFFDVHGAELRVSAVSIWEMRLKYRARHPSGARRSPHDPRGVIAVLEAQGVAFLDMTPNHAAAVLETPLGHRDPFDELLLVQAREEDLKLLTADRRLADHPLAVTA